MNDLVLDRTYRKGSRGRKVKLIQEWLCLHGFNIVIDGNFGFATEYAVKRFQGRNHLVVDGIVGKKTFERLILPMRNAIKRLPRAHQSLGRMVVACALQHYRQRPREVGGPNRGPWVRLYMDGREGPSQLWCAGFVSFILKQACQTLRVRVPIQASVSCDTLAARAKQKGFFIRGSEVANKRQIHPGYIFLKRRVPGDWVHTGIVLRADQYVLHTMEGNTDHAGSRNGYEVCKRDRDYKKKDFIVI